MARVDNKKSPKSSSATGALLGGFIGGVLFFKAIMLAGDYELIKSNSYLTKDQIQKEYVLLAKFLEKEKVIADLNKKYEDLAVRKEAQKDLSEKRARYEQELRELFEEGTRIGANYRATNQEAAEGKIWEDKTRSVLKALSRIETQVQGHSLSLDFRGNFIWYDENNPNFNHAREIIRERLNDIRNALVVLDTDGIAVAD